MNTIQSTTVDPAPGAALTPEQIVDYNQAFAASLQALQNPASLQRTQILNLVVDVLQQLIKLAGEVPPNVHSLRASIERLKHKVEEADKAVPSVSLNLAPAGSPDWFQNMMHAIGLAQENAVSAQQQLNTIGNAALTEGLAALISIVTEGEQGQQPPAAQA